MKMLIEIDLGNAAFEDGGTDEALRCIKRGVEKLRGRWPEAPVEHVLMDVNGNKVGSVEVIP